MDYTLLSPPRISREGFTDLLYNAPSDVTQAVDRLWTMLLNAGIDPAYACAQALKEHGNGTAPAWLGVAGITKSWGNSRMNTQWYGRAFDRGTGLVYETRTKWMSAVPVDRRDGFKHYYSYLDALADWCNLTRHYAYTLLLDTVSKMAPVYAPKEDGNDPVAYAASVNNKIAQWAADYKPYTRRMVITNVQVLQQVNLRSGPGSKYRDVGDLLPIGSGSPGVYAVIGRTDTGTPWNGSATWYDTGEGWFTGHPSFSKEL